MRRLLILVSICLLLSTSIISCKSTRSGAHAEDDAGVQAIPYPQATASPVAADAEELCERLAELKVIPYWPGEVAGDPIYDGLVNAGNGAIPCLVNKITDTTLMDDPRTAPKIQDFTVGDAAVFMLLYITEEPWQPETMFPPKFAELWKTEGVYAYFEFVKKPENRKKIQAWWKNWMRKNLHK